MKGQVGSILILVVLATGIALFWALPERSVAAAQRGEKWYNRSRFKAPMEDVMRLFAHGAYNDNQDEIEDALKERDRLINEMREALLREGQAKIHKLDWHYLRNKHGKTKHASTPPPLIYFTPCVSAPAEQGSRPPSHTRQVGSLF